jgi:hypothetical protein
VQVSRALERQRNEPTAHEVLDGRGGAYCVAAKGTRAARSDMHFMKRIIAVGGVVVEGKIVQDEWRKSGVG